MANFARGSISLLDFYEREVLPRLTADLVYTHPEHRWDKGTKDRWRGGCPWHRSASGTSFYVNLDTLLWRCAGCQIGGGPPSYLYRLRGGNGDPKGSDFIDIVRELAALVHLSLPEREYTDEERQRAAVWDARRSILETAIGTFEEMLWNTEGGGKAREYLQSRGFTEEMLRDLRFGYYDSGPEPLRQAISAAGHDVALAREAGAPWPKLTGFVVIPWLDERGRPLTLYGRWRRKLPILQKDHPGWNSDRCRALADFNGQSAEWKQEHPWEEPRVPKTYAIFGQGTKGTPLYFDRARRAGHKHVVLVEGVLDGAYLQGLGDTRVIACVAAQFAKEQAATLARHRIEAVTICLDPDRAGENGILSCIKTLNEHQITPYVAPQLPGIDPDEFTLNHGLDAWREHVDKAEHGYRWQAKLLIGKREAA